MKNKREGKRRTQKIIFAVIGSVLALVLLVTSGALWYINHLLNKIGRIDPELEYTVSSSEAEDIIQNDPDIQPIDPSGSEPYIPNEDIISPPGIVHPTLPSTPESPTTGTNPTTQPPTTAPNNEIFGDHLVNILLVGQDCREGEPRQRSDTMILASVNKSNHTITLTSFMRDMYVYIPGYQPNRLNAAYAFGGMSLLCKTMEVNFGVKVDGVVEVKFGQFEAIIDLLGGVDVMMTKEEAAYLHTLYEIGMLSSPTYEGKNHLDGKQARFYAQLREIDSDYQRTARQRKVLIALIEAYKNQPLDKMIGLLDEILPMVSTNLSNAEILGYAIELFPMLATAKIETLRLPLEGHYSYGLVEIRPGFCAWLQYNIDFEAHKNALWEVFRRRS